MHIVYLITHINSGLKYIGSKFNYTGNYYGSPSIKDVNHPKFEMQKFWKSELKKDISSFIFSIIEEVILVDNDKTMLNERELYWQLHYNVVYSDEYINGAYSRKSFCGIPKGYIKDKERIELLKSKGVWNTTEEQREKLRIAQTGKKYSEETNKKKGRLGHLSKSAKPIEIDGVKYSCMSYASKELGISRHVIRWRIRSDKFPTYKDVINENKDR